MRTFLVESMKGVIKHVTPKDLNSLLYCIEARIAQELATSGEFRWRGVGTFRITLRPEIQGTHPATGEPRTWPETLSVSFKPSRKFKAMVESFQDSHNLRTFSPYTDAEDSTPNYQSQQCAYR